ncbi:MAG TPA: hypothetical protein VNW90_30365 [Acetobacteraceae bacterium]|nr:hypothetical protein [Acetobacteraceae bacterium]
MDAARYVEHKQSNEPVLRGVRAFKALIDTGATSTMITKNVVNLLGLQAVTKLPYASQSGITWTPAYLFHVAFYGPIVPLSADPEESESLVNNMRVCKKVITGGEIENQESFDVLLGMDIITTGNLTINVDGSFGFAF